MATARPARATGPGRTGGPGPAPYRPRDRPGVRGRWDRPAILAALQIWSEETGAPPRRDDWRGDGDGAGPLRRKWMREHPRWPSSSCVADHFGTWSAALSEAGLPARRLTFATSVPDRVHEAQRLAARGMSLSAIAQSLGVSRSSIHNYLTARPCPECGGPVTNPQAERCAACAGPRPSVPRAWTRAAACAAIRDWAAEHGTPPTYRDWTPNRRRPGRWEAESPRWPSAATVCDLYSDAAEPWNAALRDAGLDVRQRRWSDDAVRTALAGFWVASGRAPAGADVDDDGWPGPTAATLRRRYGGLAGAWRVLGPAPPDA